MAFMCPACGWPGLDEPPRTDGVGSLEICECCDFQFGYTYEATLDYARWRREWIAEGMPWRGVHPPPEGWDPRQQLRAIESN